MKAGTPWFVAGAVVALLTVAIAFDLGPEAEPVKEKPPATAYTTSGRCPEDAVLFAKTGLPLSCMTVDDWEPGTTFRKAGDWALESCPVGMGVVTVEEHGNVYVGCRRQ